MKSNKNIHDALLLSLQEGKTDCFVSGVFGAGKTRAAAAIISELITVDPEDHPYHRKCCVPSLCRTYNWPLSPFVD